MTPPLGSLVDPAADKFDLLRGKLLAAVGRRHTEGGIALGDSVIELALFAVARHDGMAAGLQLGERGLFLIEPQSRLPGFRIGAVALVAGIGQQRPDVPVEVHLVLGHGMRRSQQPDDRNRNIDPARQMTKSHSRHLDIFRSA